MVNFNLEVMNFAAQNSSFQPFGRIYAKLVATRPFYFVIKLANYSSKLGFGPQFCAFIVDILVHRRRFLPAEDYNFNLWYFPC